MQLDEKLPMFLFLVSLFMVYIAPILFVQWPQGEMSKERILTVRSALLWVLTGAGWLLLFLTATEVELANSWVRMQAAYATSILTTVIAGCVLVHESLKRPQ